MSDDEYRTMGNIPYIYLVREVWGLRHGIGEILLSDKNKLEALLEVFHREAVYEPYELFGGGMDSSLD